MNFGRLLCFLFLLLIIGSCLADDKIPAEAEIRKMKVKELRKFLDDRGLPCDGCVEKADFVKKAIAAKSTPILDSKKPRVVNKDPIEKQWAPIVAEVCEAETDNESYCKQLKNIVDGFFFQYMRKYKRDLSVQEYHAAEVSFKHPYFAVGKIILKEVVQFMVKENTKKSEKVRAKLEARAVPWLRDVCLENPNPMFEELGETGGPSSGKRKGRRAGGEL
jgi:hypothetical protein